MISQSSVNIKSIPLCSRCAAHEINSWLNEQFGRINPEVIQQIAEELRAIKLASGQCIVCNHTSVSDGCFEGILQVFEKSDVSKKVVDEFKKLFGFVLA